MRDFDDFEEFTNQQAKEPEKKKDKSGNDYSVLDIAVKILWLIGICFCITMLIFEIFKEIEINRKSIARLESQVNEYQTDIQIMQKEIETLKAFVDKPLEEYTVDELMTIDMVKEFDATYRAELDDDPDIANFVIMDVKNITEGFLKNRKKLGSPMVIERVFGIVQDDKLNGKIIDAGNTGNYISYHGVKNAQKGDLIVTYMMYADNNIPDDILVREDFVIKDVQ